MTKAEKAALDASGWPKESEFDKAFIRAILDVKGPHDYGL